MAIASMDDLAAWLYRQYAALHRRIGRMPKGNLEASEARMREAKYAMIEIGRGYRRRKKKLDKR